MPSKTLFASDDGTQPRSQVARADRQGDTAASPEDMLLTERDLARRWGCSVKKLQADRLSGVGPGYLKLGRLVRYPFQRILAYEQTRLRAASSNDK